MVTKTIFAAAYFLLGIFAIYLNLTLIINGERVLVSIILIALILPAFFYACFDLWEYVKKHWI